MGELSRYITSPPLCPCCGSDASNRPDPMHVLANTQLGPKARSIYLILARHMGKWLRASAIAERLYANDPSGGPDDAETCVRMIIATSRKRLKGTGIVLEGRAHSGYRLSWEAE